MTETDLNPPSKTTDHGSDGSDKASWSSETTWVITSGALENSFTFDSSDDSPPDSPRNSTPLLLNPPSHDSGPCEIKLYFSQKYNIRQIYVRSTARVYEVYHSQSPQGASEYLCTARCCIAERDDGVLQAKFSKSPTEAEMSDGKFGEESNANSEDDWVDVEVVGSRLSDDRSLALLNETKCHIKEVVQDYYEATVEINDSEPCASVTIRFLSLQSKECVLIDEIYIFAELIGPIESESSAPSEMSSAGSSLMAMLLPTLLQLSKSGKADQVSDNLGKVNEVEILSKAPELTDAAPQILQGEQSEEDQQYVKLKDSEILGKVNKVEILSKETHLIDTVSETSQDRKSNSDNQSVKLQNLGKYSMEPVQGQHQNHNLAGDGSSFDPVVTHSPPHGRIEEVLEQLVSRVSKIEEVCLRFEENMLKPLNRMERRIQRVEEQLESLTKSPQCTGLPTGTRFVAPSFSCDTNSSSIYKDGSDNASYSKITELDKNESDASSVLSNPSEVILESVQATRFLPNLVVTAPDFSCDEDDQDSSVSNLVNGSSEGKSKRLVDDILAAALSNFLLSPSDNPSECKQTVGSQYNGVQAIGSTESSQITETIVNSSVARERACDPPKYTQIFTFKAPEFTLEEIDSDQYTDHLQLASSEGSVLSNPSEVILESVQATRFLPSLVVTAPDFSCDEDDQDASVSNLVNGSSEGKSKRLVDDILAAALSNFLLSPSDNPSECKQTAGSQYNGVQAIGSTESSQIMETIVNSSVARERACDPPKYTQIFTFKAPEFTLEEIDSDQYTDHLQLPSEEASTPAARTGEHLQVPLSPSVSGSFPATLELSLCHENKSLVYSGCESLQNDLLARSASFSSDKSEDFERTDYCKAVDESRQSSSSILSSPRKDAPEPDFRCSIDVDSDSVKAVAVAEGSVKVFESQTASSEIDMAWMNVKFTSHANSSAQLPLEALLGGTSIPEHNFTANSSGDNFVDSGSDEMIDSLRSRHLLVDLGIYDIVGNSDEESEVDNHSISSSNFKPEMVASLI